MCVNVSRAPQVPYGVLRTDVSGGINVNVLRMRGEFKLRMRSLGGHWVFCTGTADVSSRTKVSLWSVHVWSDMSLVLMN